MLAGSLLGDRHERTTGSPLISRGSERALVKTLDAPAWWLGNTAGGKKTGRRKRRKI
jgi:hypothetical protein